MTRKSLRNPKTDRAIYWRWLAWHIRVELFTPVRGVAYIVADPVTGLDFTVRGIN